MNEQSVATITVEDGVGIIAIDSPPVNALGVRVRQALDDGFRQLSQDAAVRAIVLICEGRTFFAGADISEFGKPPLPPSLDAVFDIIENGPKPVLAAMHGSALGGGFEMALMCHYRIALPSTKLGLPEVKLGIMPGAGGTQRLPRIIGVPAALDLITSGETLDARTALELGLLDALAQEGALRESAVAFARSIIGKPFTRARDRQERIEAARGDPDLFTRFRTGNAERFRGRAAPENIVRAIEAAVALPFEAGLARERELLADLRSKDESRAMSYLFFAQRGSAKVPSQHSTPAQTIRSAALKGPHPLPPAFEAILKRANVSLDKATGSEAGAADADLIVLLPEHDDYREPGWRTLLGATSGRDGPSMLVDAESDGDGEWPEVTNPQAIGLRASGSLLEIGMGPDPRPETLAAAIGLAKRSEMIPAMSRTLRPSICRRLERRLRKAAAQIMAEGVDQAAIAAVLYEFGFPAAGEKVEGEPPVNMSELTRRLLYPVVDEAALLIQEDIVLRASDIDVAAVLGCGWPMQKGGPLFWADGIGLSDVVSDLGSDCTSALLREKAEAGTLFVRPPSAGSGQG
jgi:enoyl-CoA hydratase/carnithine racemase